MKVEKANILASSQPTRFCKALQGSSMGLREQKPLVEEVGDGDVVEDEAEGVEDVGVGEDEHSNYS